ncbi:MAG: hypothetical protein JNN17_02400 [Verrucomicrobiaceae bacterium]|nr:hypothetical protein [Verrucomicrobiaceae bacterium]
MKKAHFTKAELSSFPALAFRLIDAFQRAMNSANPPPTQQALQSANLGSRLKATIKRPQLNAIIAASL